MRRKKNLIEFRSLLLAFLLLTILLSVSASASAVRGKEGLFVKVDIRDTYSCFKPIRLDVYVGGIIGWRPIEGTILVNITIWAGTTPVRWLEKGFTAGTKTTVHLDGVDIGVYECTALATWQSYTKKQRFEILVLPIPEKYSIMFFNNGEKLLFVPKTATNFTIRIMGEPVGSRYTVEIITVTTNTTWEYYIQPVSFSLFGENKPTKYNLIRVDIQDCWGWINYENGGESYYYLYIAPEPYKSYTIVRVVIIVAILLIGAVLLRYLIIK